MHALTAIGTVAGVVVVVFIGYQCDRIARMIGVELEHTPADLEMRAAHARVLLNRALSTGFLPSTVLQREDWTGRGAVGSYTLKMARFGPSAGAVYRSNVIASVAALAGAGKTLAGDALGFVHPAGMERLGYSPFVNMVPDDYPAWAKVHPRLVGPVLFVGKASKAWI